MPCPYCFTALDYDQTALDCPAQCHVQSHDGPAVLASLIELKDRVANIEASKFEFEVQFENQWLLKFS